MKTITYFLLLVLFSLSGSAQIITIPDANFKAKLLEANTSNTLAKDSNGNNIKIDSNNNGEIEQNEALLVYELFYTNPPPFRMAQHAHLTNYNITNASGIEYFTNLRKLDLNANQLTTLNLSTLINLEILNCNQNDLTSVTISNLPMLKNIDFSGNNLTSLNLSGLNSLQRIECSSNALTSLDFSNLTNVIKVACNNNLLTDLVFNNNPHLYQVFCNNNNLTNLDFSHTSVYAVNCSNNPNLIFLNVKNGVISPDNYDPMPPLLWQENTFMLGNTNIQYICHDENEIGYMLVYNQNLGNVSHNSYCTFEPGGGYNIITGSVHYDCPGTNLAQQHIKLNLTNGPQSGSTYSNQSGNYTFYTGNGNHTLTPEINTAYFTISPATATINFATSGNTQIQNFCITPNGNHPDLEITLLPLNVARPGFDTNYAIIYKNNGTVTQSGSVNLSFEDDVLDFVSANPVTATQTLNNLSWNFTNLLPFESRQITFKVNVNTPMETPAVNIGDVLDYSAAITSVAIDETPNNNIFALHQTVVGSFDPNSKTCVEGASIAPAKVGDYVNYIIHFENNGTYPAENIVVADFIDLSKFDISSMVPISSSHSFATKITNGNKVEFIFENINLPFDDTNNDGYIAFKIKTKSTLVLNDTFTNKANIYFDYNFPVVTNTASTTVQLLGRQDFEFNNYFTLYPNPARNNVTIDFKNDISVGTISVLNTLGQLVKTLQNPVQNNNVTIDISDLNSGTYFINIISDKGKSVGKFIKI